MSNSLTNSRHKTYVLVGTALFTAIVVVLQFVGSYLRFSTFSISLVLMPIVVGAAMYGVLAGAWLGFVFGVIVLLSGDAAGFMVLNAPGTIVTVLAKGILAGLLAALVYKTFANKNRYLAVLLASVTCPIVNTGCFLLGCRLFFFDTIAEWGAGAGVSAWHYTIFVLVGINFIIELVINLALNPIIVRLIDIGKKTSKTSDA